MYTEEELSLLSAEEREAITAEKSPEEEAAGLRKIAGEDDEHIEDDDKSTDKNEATDKPDQVDQPENKDTGEDERTTFIPTYRANPVDGYDEKLSALDARFDSGDVTHSEYNRERDALIRAQTKAEFAAESAEQTATQLWEHQQTQFFEDNDAYYHTAKATVNTARLAALDATVKEIAGKPENVSRSGTWCLREAHKIVQADLGGAESKADEGKQVIPKRPSKPDLSVVGKTLSGLPAAEVAQTGDVDEFAHLDRMSGLELEKAVSRLSESERERYRAA
jgi:hypothetical protein